MSGACTRSVRGLAAAGLLALILPHDGLAAAATSRESQRERRRSPRHEAPTPLADQRPEPAPVAVVGADIHPVVGPVVEGGTLLLRDGRIEAILPARRAARRRLNGYQVIDGTGLRAYPGLVAAAADGLGLDLFMAGPSRDPVPGRLADNFNPWSDAVELAASGGVTSALVYHVTGVRDAPLDGVASMLKMSFGEPRGVALKEPAAVLSGRLLSPEGRVRWREAVEAARRWRDEPAARRRPSPLHELVLQVAGRHLPMLVAPQSAGEVATALAVAEAEGLRLILYQPTEAWAVADRLAGRSDIAVIQHVRTAWWKPRADRRGAVPGGWRFDAPAVLARAGVPVAVLPVTDVVTTWGVAGRDLIHLNIEAAFAQRGGLDPEQALAAITIVPARMYGVADRIGSLERGKDADVILVDGDVLDYASMVRVAIVNGRVVYEAKGNRFWGWVTERRDRDPAALRPPPLAPAADPTR